nr:benzoate/H(+) symporter BenE family transporter [Leucobacter chinensis]
MSEHCNNGSVKDSLAQPVSVGIVTALVGFTSSFAVVLAGLAAVGATPAQATLGLIALNVTQGLATIWLSWRHKAPLLTAWSTPGAAILIATAGVAGGWSAAIGAFVVGGLLVVLTAAWPMLGRLIQAIPASVAQAMLAGVLMMICLQPVIALADNPLWVAPILVVWLVLSRFLPRWATPAAFGLALVLIASAVIAGGQGFSVPAVEPVFVMPTFEASAIIGIAVPLYIVTMASQNVPGVAIMKAQGYEVPWRESLLVTGVGTVAGAPAGGHMINLAAITAALPSSAEAHPNPEKRWIAAHTAGYTYLVLAALTPLLTAAVAVAPAGIIETVAGLALIGTLVSSLAAAFADPQMRIATGVTFLVAASPVVIFGIGSAFWGMVFGLLTWSLFRYGGRRAA